MVFKNKIKKIQKREGEIVPFDQSRITNAILKAGQAMGEFNHDVSQKISDKVVMTLNKLYSRRKKPPQVEEIQDIVEIELMRAGYTKSSKAYILYRKERAEVREEKKRILSGRTTKLPLSVNALRVLAGRYLLRNLATKEILETPEEMFQRVAKALAHVEKRYSTSPKEIKKIEQEFYGVMANFEFLPAGRTLTNAGASTPVVSNCIVLHIEDSMEGIFNTLRDAALLQQAGSGLGFPFHMLRAAGSLAKKSMGVASGPVSFLKVYDQAFGVIKQQGRHGANMAVMRVDHPDILEFIRCKEREGDIKNFNISVALTDEFIRQVKEKSKEPWMCQFGGQKMPPRMAVRDRDRYGTVIQVKEVQITAEEIMAEIVQAAWSNGEPGVIFIDEVNRTNPLPGLGKIEACNPCVTGDTWAMTDQGPRKVINLLNKEFNAIVNGQIWNSPKGFFETGTKPVYKLQTKEGFELRLTQEHLVMRVDIEPEWVEAKELKHGDKVLLNNHVNFQWEGKYSEQEGYLMGLFFGDGTINKAKPGGKIVLSSWGENLGSQSVRNLVYQYANNLEHRADFQGWTQVVERDEYRLSLVSIDQIARSLGVETKKVITSEIEETSPSFYRGFLRGIFDADGSVQGSQLKGVSIRLSQSNLPLLKAVQRMLLRLGINSKIYVNRRNDQLKELPDGKGGLKEYHIKAQHDLVISKRNLSSFYQRIGFGDAEKQTKLVGLLESYKRKLNREDFLATVEKIGLDGEEKVYDTQVPGINVFDANGFYVHNCGEQFLHDGDVCNLGSINLDKFAENGKIKWDRLKEVVRIATRMLDNVVDITAFPSERVNNVFRKNRRIGLGLMGFADMLFQLNIPYNSKEGFETAEKVMACITKESHQASQELAKEKGVFTNWKNSVFKKKGVKIRNAALTTIAPTGSISMIADVSSGLEPYFALAYIKEVMGGQKLYYTNRHLEERLRKEEIFTEKLAQKIAERGTLQDINEIPENIKKVFVGALDISPLDHVKMQAAFQKYVDNSISKTINFPNKSPQSEVLEAYILAWESKCKSCTVYRESSRESEVLSLVDKGGGKPSSAVLDLLEPQKNVCPKCGGELVFQEGCASCPQCGFGLCAA